MRFNKIFAVAAFASVLGLGSAAQAVTVTFDEYLDDLVLSSGAPIEFDGTAYTFDVSDGIFTIGTIKITSSEIFSIGYDPNNMVENPGIFSGSAPLLIEFVPVIPGTNLKLVQYTKIDPLPTTTIPVGLPLAQQLLATLTLYDDLVFDIISPTNNADAVPLPAAAMSGSALLALSALRRRR